MPNLTTPNFRDNLPSHLQNVKLDDFTSAFSASGGSVKRITLRGRVFRLIDGGKEIAKNTDPHLDVVVVNGSRSVQKSYYASEYDPEETSAPDCWSNDGERPDADVPNPQAARCKECPKAIKGSASQGRAACRYSMRLAVVLRNNIGGDIYQLVLPQKSLFGQGEITSMPFLQYAKYVAHSGFNLNMLVTRMSFDTDADYPKLVFSNAEFLSKDDYEIALEQGQSPIAVTASKMNFRKKEDAVAEMPKLVAPAGSAAAQIKAQAEEEEAPAPAPTKRAEKAKASPPPKLDLANMVDEWGDK